MTARGTKVAAQKFKVYVAEVNDDGWEPCLDPAVIGAGGETVRWREITSARFESIQVNSGLAANVCLLTEIKAPPEDSFKVAADAPGYGNGKTGTGGYGNLFLGADLDVDYLVKVTATDVPPASQSVYLPIFLGVVTKPTFDLNTMILTWPCEDYRHFMKKCPLYGRYCAGVQFEDEIPTLVDQLYIRGFRMTFNEGGQPDRLQKGDTYNEGDNDQDLGLWCMPLFNRSDATIPGGPAVAGTGVLWADYWLAGHAWNYLRDLYGAASPRWAAPSEIAHLNFAAFVNWPAASIIGDLEWLFYNEVEGPVIVKDLALNGVSLDKAISLLVERAGPYDWTLVPNADGYTVDLVTFNTHAGIDTINYTWGDYLQTVAAALPQVEGGRIVRDQTEYYNRGYAASRRKIVETTLTTIDNFYGASPPTPRSLVGDWEAADLTAYLAASDDDRRMKFKNVLLRYIVPPGYDWGPNKATADKIFTSNHPALNVMITQGSAAASAYAPAPALRPLRPMLWRSKDSGTTWEAAPDSVPFIVLPDNCGILLCANAREGKTPWIWDGNAGDPHYYDLMVTLAIQTSTPIDKERDDSEAGERARELFVDCGNVYRPAERVNAYFPVDGSGNPTGGVPVAGNPTKFGTPGTPVPVIDESAGITAELNYQMDRKSATFIQGNLPIWGLRINPWPIGYLLGQLLVSSSEPTRQTLDLNACIRAFKFARDQQSTVFTLDGR